VTADALAATWDQRAAETELRTRGTIKPTIH